jgi:hypothetical protein
MRLYTQFVSRLAPAKRTSPAVAHERVLTTAYEKSSAIFRRGSKMTMTQDVVTRAGVMGYCQHRVMGRRNGRVQRGATDKP